MTGLSRIGYPSPELSATPNAADLQRALADAGWLTAEPLGPVVDVFSPRGRQKMTILVATDEDGTTSMPIRFRLFIGGRQVSFRAAHDYIEGEA